jgi:alpha-galactosidase
MLSRTHYAAESDFSDFPRSIRAINALTLVLPPEALAYYHNHMPTAHQMTSLETHLRVAMFAQPIFVGFGAQDVDRTTPYFLTTKRYIQLINEVAAPIVGGKPQVYHHTPAIGTQGPADWCVLEYALPDRSIGYAGLFRLGAHARDEYLFRPRGISLTKRYAVTLDNSCETVEMSGAELRRNGLLVRLDCPNTSELVLYQSIVG